MLCCKGNTFEKIWLGSGTITTIRNCDDSSFTQFRGKSNTCRMQNMCCYRCRACHHIMLVIAPRRYLLYATYAILFIELCADSLTISLDIGTKHLLRRHSYGQNDAKVPIIRQSEILPYFNTDRAAYLGRFM